MKLVSIGNQRGISSTAVELARAHVSEVKESGEKQTADTVLNDLKNQFKGTNFTVGTKPGAGIGTNNITIAPSILREMASNPEKRVEYEAVIRDQVAAAGVWKQLCPNVQNAGFVIHSDGNSSGWSMSRPNGENGNGFFTATVKRKENWIQEMMNKLQEQREERAKKAKAGKGAAVVANVQTKAKEQQFRTTNDLISHLHDKYNVVKEGYTSISSKYLQDCLADEGKSQSLMEKLAAADEALAAAKEKGGFQSMKVKIDENGEVTTETVGRSVGFNGNKIARKLAAATSSRDINAILTELQSDLAVCQDGLRDGACDEAEVQKVKDMIARAQQRQGELLGKPEDKSAQTVSLDLII